MPARETTRRRFQIDRLISKLRWLLLLGVALVVFLDIFTSHRDILEANRLLPQILLLTTAVLYNIAVLLFLAHSSDSKVLPVLTLVLDTLVVIGLIVSSGGLTSPLLFFALFPVLTATLRFSQPVSLIIALGVIASFGGAIYLVSPPSSWSDALSFIAYSLVLLLAGLVSSFVSREAKKSAVHNQQDEIERERRKLHAAREHSRLTFELAGTLSATLNYSKVLRAVLEVGEKGMQELGQDKASQVGAVLLFSHNDLRIVASRHLTPRDRNVVFQGKEGALADALATAEAIVVADPSDDPELSKLASIHGCKTAIVVPLRAGFESFGVVIFGNSEANIYTDDLVNLLTAICNQAIVALQNAQLYQDLREEKERIVAVEEDARKKLARNLHDGPTQSIASIAMQASFVRRLVENDTSRDQVSEELERIEDLARETTKQIRHMLFTLRPLILETQGLRAALEQYISKLLETSDITISLEAASGADEALDQETQGIVFYIVEEAISNARKHSGADRVCVRLYLQGEEAFVAEVEDDGRGFDVDAVQMTYDRRGSLGLINMHERAEMTNGELSIASGPGEGTQVRLTVPLAGSA
jgi:signal transduction histidine kinase